MNLGGHYGFMLLVLWNIELKYLNEILGREKIFLSIPQSPEWFSGQSRILFDENREFSLDVKRPGRQVKLTSLYCQG
jgi:hypothetical protein